MRLAGWERGFYALIREASTWKYELGVRDCFRLACADVAALTGVDRWPEFEGYRTHRGMLAKLAVHGSSFVSAGDWFFGAPRIDIRMARRGDVAVFADPDGRKHLALVLDHRLAVLKSSESGLEYPPRSIAFGAWKVGYR